MSANWPTHLSIHPCLSVCSNLPPTGWIFVKYYGEHFVDQPVHCINVGTSKKDVKWWNFIYLSATRGFCCHINLAVKEADWVSFKEINKGLQSKLSIYILVVFVVRILHSFINVTILWHFYVHNFHIKILEDMKNISCKIDRCDGSLSMLQISCAEAVNVISCVIIFSFWILAVLINLNSKVAC